ncbi:MAG: SDR family oxidoreductase [Deltaproteobacteria bacterium]|nr:SDR family oxidoreductase [Deltaproteobacteria bacterium]
MKKILITGGDGFIGSHLAESLLTQGARVRILDNLSTRAGANLDFLKSLNSGHLETVIDDIRSPESCQRACQGMDYVLHQAGLGSVPKSIEDPLISHDINATGTLNMLWAAKKAGVKRFVWASSSSVYGDPSPAQSPKEEALKPRPISPYAAAKLSAEHYARLFFRHYGLETVSLRYFNVFGPRQDPDSPYAAVIPKFIQALSSDRPPTVFGDGKQSRDFTYISLVVAANLSALKAPQAPGRVINVASGQAHNLLDVLARLQRLMGKEVEPVFAPPRPGDVSHSLADISLAVKILGFKPEPGFEQGLAQTVAWHQG